MTEKPYHNKALLYELYVKKRMPLKDIAELFKNNYNCAATPQTIYNWLERHDLLKFRGKGKKINLSRGKATPKAQGRSGPYATGLSMKKPPKGYRRPY